MYRGGVTGNRFVNRIMMSESIPRSRHATIIKAEWKIQLVSQLSDS